MDIEIPDGEDAACDLDQLESYFARRGQYEEAAMVSGAARRIRADAEWIGEVRRLADQYRSDQIDACDRPSSWVKLHVLLAAIGD